MQNDYRWLAVKILAVIGIGLALFLLWERYYQPAWQPCKVNATVNCDAVISGPVADTLGVPTAAIGLTGYVIMLIAAFWRRKKLFTAMAIFGFGFCAYIAFREFVQLKVVCPVCIGCDLDMTGMAILAYLFNRKTSSPA